MLACEDVCVDREFGCFCASADFLAINLETAAWYKARQ
jgi:hypothetical protein